MGLRQRRTGIPTIMMKTNLMRIISDNCRVRLFIERFFFGKQREKTVTKSGSLSKCIDFPDRFAYYGFIETQKENPCKV
jgi:hypothetical protein